MNVEAYRDLQLLTDISSGESVTQRSLAKRYRLALGLINFLMRRLVKKGHVKIINLERKRLRYLITPKGLAEKARLTYEYLEYSLYFYRQIRTFLAEALTVIVQSGGNNAILYGTGEVAEVAFLTMQQHGINIVAVLGEEANGPASFMNRPVKPLTELPTLSYDWVVVASLRDHRAIVEHLGQRGVPAEKIITISDEGQAAARHRAEAAVILEAPIGILEARVR